MNQQHQYHATTDGVMGSLSFLLKYEEKTDISTPKHGWKEVKFSIRSKTVLNKLLSMLQQLFYVKYVSMPKEFENKISLHRSRIEEQTNLILGKVCSKQHGCLLNRQCHEIFKLGFFTSQLHVYSVTKINEVIIQQCHWQRWVGLAITATTKQNTEKKNYQSYPSEQTRG